MTTQEFAVRALLQRDGFVEAEIERRDGRWSHYRIRGPTSGLSAKDYFVTALPFEFHCHGIGQADFSNIEGFDFEAVNAAAAAEGVLCIPTLYLPHSQLSAFVRFMRRYQAARRSGKVPFIPGIALEGPLLASFGGTPEMGVWPPSKQEWEVLASCGDLGLQYTVISPDALMSGSAFADPVSRDYPSLEWIIALLVDAGIRPALGHFTKLNPAGSAACVERVLRAARGRGRGGEPGAVVTDHLFNDMPLKVPHAWRTKQARAVRERELQDIHMSGWTIDNLGERVGEVPAALVRAARDGRLKICLNFDGDHVDPALCRRAVELVGSDSLIAMTDRTDAPALGGQKLSRVDDNSLWYQDRGIVAAGSQPIDRQMANMRRMGIAEFDIWRMTSFVPHDALRLGERGDLVAVGLASHVTHDGRREVVSAPQAVVDDASVSRAHEM